MGVMAGPHAPVGSMHVTYRGADQRRLSAFMVGKSKEVECLNSGAFHEGNTEHFSG